MTDRIDDVTKLIGNRIRQARERLGITQEELAFRIGSKQGAISKYESGSRAIHLSELPELARALEVPVAYLFGDIEPDEEMIQVYNRLKPEAKRLALAYLHMLEEQIN